MGKDGASLCPGGAKVCSDGRTSRVGGRGHIIDSVPGGVSLALRLLTPWPSGFSSGVLPPHLLGGRHSVYGLPFA